MKILLVSATEAEVAPLLAALQVPIGDVAQVRSVAVGAVTVEVVITGVGMVSTAFCLGRSLNNSYDFALNLGLAGSFSRSIELGQVLNIIQDQFSELGAEDGPAFLPAAGMNLGIQHEWMNTQISDNPVLKNIPMVSGITVNTVHGHEPSIEAVFQRCHPQTESMEGAAFLMACHAMAIPCAQIRSISNYVERRNRAAWNIPLALRNLNSTALEIIHAF
jgi:futalosine hydrolase